MEDDLKILKVENLSNQLLDLPLLNLHIGYQQIFFKNLEIKTTSAKS
jgi:hypothetical protein